MIYGKYLFRKFFIEYFDEKYKDGSKKGGVVLSNDQLPNNLKKALEDYELVRLPKDWTQVFIQAGAPYDLSIVPDMYEDRVTSPIGLDYGGESWNRERILIDGCQNHLPSDAGGKNIFVRFQTKDGTWHDHTEFSDYNDEDIVSVKISDDGIGYDYKSLGIMASTKEGEETSGKWGEGLKVIAAAAVRNGEHIRLVSRNWEAVPSITDEVLNLGKVNEKHINRLNFDVKVRTIKSEEDINPSLEKGEASATIFDNPSPELINLFKNVQDYVLMLSDKRPFVRVENTDLLDFSGGKIYVKNLLIPGEHDTLYSYHFRDFNINSRDRDSITPDEMRGLIWKFLYGLKDKRIIKLFLKDAVEYAKKTGDNPYYEFNTKFTIPNQSENSDAWIEAFKEFFGERACVRKASDQNPYFVGQAEHFGLRTITLPDFIANQLLAIESRDGKKIPSYEKLLQEALDNEFNVHEEDLTKEEKAIIEQLYSYNKILEMKNGKKDYIKKIEVYDYPPEYEGLKALGHSKLGNKVSISRETLSEGLEFATDVFIHECGHAETGAKDSAPEFRDNITSNFAAYVVRTFPIVKSVMDNGLAKGIIASRFENFLRKIFQRITYRNRVQETEPEEREED